MKFYKTRCAGWWGHKVVMIKGSNICTRFQIFTIFQDFNQFLAKFQDFRNLKYPDHLISGNRWKWLRRCYKFRMVVKVSTLTTNMKVYRNIKDFTEIYGTLQQFFRFLRFQISTRFQTDCIRFQGRCGPPNDAKFKFIGCIVSMYKHRF